YQGDAAVDRYDIVYQGSVTGLKEGSPVRFSGVRIGEVVLISLDPDRPGDVRVTIEVDRETSPVREDTQASLELEGLTGGRYILLHAGSIDARPPQPPDEGGNPVLTARSSAFEKVLEGAPEVLDNANLLLLRANEVLNEENRKNLATVLRQLADITTEIAAHREEIRGLLKDANLTMSNLRDASESLQEMAYSLEGDIKLLTEKAAKTLDTIDALGGEGQRVLGEVSEKTGRTLSAFETLANNTDTAITDLSAEARRFLSGVDSTSRQLEETMQEIEALVAENREPLRDFTATGLYEFSLLLTEARGLVRELGQVTSEIQRDPARFFFGDRQQGYETE
ncbi:MAG: MlaD family protein, partial [Kiloniellales bacterium]|nr:MlaD family protein [Kiloniellales bacterium]